ncbi:putative Sensor histidine kinase FleS [Nitrospira sp. KM1]|uniref:two-component system sensor histidine kinase NtrB n=1 Tax=Nitrospira sp. KM1 TaxID=1936990 RepID=UPI0013A7195D|nr:ATP-binding protein [Nitrospira sp. KM1]BCA54823.1 putative Sensor histidine kinase FleS [Nitrospira sp. KM1]
MTVQAAPMLHDADLLQAAFRSFDGAAATLQQSYRALTSRLEQLDLELADRNETLKRNLRANEELREHLTAIVESLTTGILVTDAQGTVTRCNRAGEQLLGLSRDNILGRPLAACLGESGLDSDEYPLTTKNGATATLAQKPLCDVEGQPAGGLTLIQDVSAVHQLEARLQRRDRLAAMGEMVGRIAHEIRNPLGSIELFASILRRDLKDQESLKGYAEHISSAVQLLDRLLSNLLLYTKPDCSKGDRHMTEALFIDALTLAAHAIANARLDIKMQVDPSVSHLWCDAGQIKQSLLNLILNAVQAMPDGGTLTLAATAEENQRTGHRCIRLSVTDTGIGIPTSHQARIFDPFFTTRDEGTGLGLAIVHAIVEAHGGRIDVHSTVGQGTTFTMILPFREHGSTGGLPDHQVRAAASSDSEMSGQGNDTEEISA